MPEVSRFYGIVIMVYFGDHQPPHFHAEYGEFEAVVAIDSQSVLAGELPARALALVSEWAALRRRELEQAWERAHNLDPPGRIPPLP